MIRPDYILIDLNDFAIAFAFGPVNIYGPADRFEGMVKVIMVPSLLTAPLPVKPIPDVKGTK